MALSLRSQLLAWVLVPLALLAAFNATMGWHSAREAANLITDRTLLASARTIAEQARLEDGAVQIVVPPAAIEMFDNGAGDFVYYAVTEPSGSLLAGVSGLPVPPARDLRGEAYQADFRGRHLRLISVVHPLTGPGTLTSARVVVGVTSKNRDGLLRHLWFVGFWQQLTLILAVGLSMALGLRRGLAPLIRLRDAVLERSPDSLEPLDPGAVQAELQPLVIAINRQVARVQTELAAQHRFVMNAAHQIRTPLTLVNLQATYALRHPGTDETQTTLKAIRTSTQQLARLAGQLLTLSRAEPSGRPPGREVVDLGRVAANVIESFAEVALAKGIDLGFEELRHTVILSDSTLLGEVLVNLVDNALRYCPNGSVATVTVDRKADQAVVSVQDDGPGVSPHEIEHLFERFYRVPGTGPEGSGLGLAIVREVSAALGGWVIATNRTPTGLLVEVCLPAPAELEVSLRRPLKPIESLSC